VFSGLVIAWRFATQTDQTFAGFREGDDRRRGAHSLRIRDDDGLSAFHDGDAGIGRPEIDTDDLAHVLLLVRGETPGASIFQTSSGQGAGRKAFG
jgi:hypothetical protein